MDLLVKKENFENIDFQIGKLMEKIWQDSEKAINANVETKIMAPHSLSIHLSEYALRVTHSFSKFCYFCDIDHVIHFHKDCLD